MNCCDRAEASPLTQYYKSKIFHQIHQKSANLAS